MSRWRATDTSHLCLLQSFFESIQSMIVAFCNHIRTKMKEIAKLSFKFDRGLTLHNEQCYFFHNVYCIGKESISFNCINHKPTLSYGGRITYFHRTDWQQCFPIVFQSFLTNQHFRCGWQTNPPSAFTTYITGWFKNMLVVHYFWIKHFFSLLTHAVQNSSETYHLIIFLGKVTKKYI